MQEEFILSKTDRKILASYEHMLDGLALYLGSGYELVLHSLEDFSHSVIKIINGHYTQRTVGAPITDLALNMLHDMQKHHNTDTKVYFNKRNGQTLKSTTIPILGENNRIIGLLCINFYCDISFLQALSAFVPQEEGSFSLPKEAENFNTDIDDVISTSLEKAKETIYSSPDILSVNRNKEIIRLLQEQGIFNIKDSVVKVADALGISKNTVYLHLRKLKNY